MTRAADGADASMMWLGCGPTRTVSEWWWSKTMCAPGTYGRLVMMSFPVILTLPSCMSFGCTKTISSIMSRWLSSVAHTRPSKSLRVTSLYFTRSPQGQVRFTDRRDGPGPEGIASAADVDGGAAGRVGFDLPDDLTHHGCGVAAS